MITYDLVCCFPRTLNLITSMVSWVVFCFIVAITSRVSFCCSCVSLVTVDLHLCLVELISSLFLVDSSSLLYSSDKNENYVVYSPL